MIGLTESAAKEINTILEREGKDGYGLRVRVIGVTEGQQLRQRAVGQRRKFGFSQRRIRTR